MLELNRLYNMDCMEGMKQFPDKFFELAIVDPEYGRRQHGGVSRSGFVVQNNGKKMYVRDGRYKRKEWDVSPASPDYFSELFRVSKNQIIWGCNYYSQQFGPGRIVWDKVNDGADQSNCEIAFNSLTTRVDIFRYMWRGMMQGKSASEGSIMQGNKKKNEKRIHPTQKPVELYKWLLSKFANPSDKILDTHVGSASSLIACMDMGFDYVGFELDLDYHTAASDRIEVFQSQLKLF